MGRKTGWIALIAASAALGLYVVFGTGPALHPPSDLSDLLGMPQSPVRVMDVSALEDEITIERDVAVMTRDATRLSANVYRPKAPGRYPVVMAITAYHKDDGPRRYPDHLRNSLDPNFDMGTFEVSPWTPWEGPSNKSA